MPDHNLPSDAFQAFSATSFNGPSASSQPIPAALFAEAIKDLPVDTLYAKAAEIQNSISHLLSSNIQMKPFADEGDEVCKDAVAENDQVMRRMEERIGLLRAEAESRGLRWSAHGENSEDAGVAAAMTNGRAHANGETEGERHSSGRLTDEELRAQLDALMENDDDEEDGVHL